MAASLCGVATFLLGSNMRRLFDEEMVERGGMYLLKFNKLQSYLITVPRWLYNFSYAQAREEGKAVRIQPQV
jgi:hypothetical protein